jgi:aminodeoxyfutalosine synthase
MAGAGNTAMSTKDIVELIKQVNRKPVEKDTLYNELKDYGDVVFEEKKEFFR